MARYFHVDRRARFVAGQAVELSRPDLAAFPDLAQHFNVLFPAGVSAHGLLRTRRVACTTGRDLSSFLASSRKPGASLPQRATSCVRSRLPPVAAFFARVTVSHSRAANGAARMVTWMMRSSACSQ